MIDYLRAAGDESAEVVIRQREDLQRKKISEPEPPETEKKKTERSKNLWVEGADGERAGGGAKHLVGRRRRCDRSGDVGE